MADIFGRTPLTLQTPITADQCHIEWEGEVGTAIQFSLEYSQQVTRRRSIGNQNAVIFGSQPMGRATIARLLTTGENGFTQQAWSCGKSDSKITFKLGGCGGEGGGGTYTATGCIVSSFSIQASAEDLTVMDNVVIEFLELTKG